MCEFQEREVKNRLKEGVQDLTQIIKSEQDQVPSEEVYRVTESGEKRRELVSQPSKVISEYGFGEEPTPKSVTEMADWLYETDYGFELRISDQDGNQIENPDKDQVVPWYSREILRFVGEVMDYTGGFTYSEDAFESAFKNEFEPKYARSNSYEVIVPLLKFDGPGDIIKLDPDIDIDINDDHKGEVTYIEVSPLTSEELSGIYTFENRIFTLGSTGLRRAGFWSHKLTMRFDTDGGRHGGLENKALDRVLTALRLFKSETGVMGAERSYSRDPNWLDHREGIMNLESSMGTQGRPILRGKGYELEDNEVPELRDFWERYRHELDSQDESNVSTAIRRFNQTYTKETEEDRLVDCVIAFETTLLSEITQHASYRFRLPLRAGLFLHQVSDEDREYIYEFFKNIYDARSNVVHTGGELRERSVNGEDLRPRDFVNKTREFLRVTILKYLEGQSEGMSVEDINDEIDDALIHANYPIQG